VAQDPTSHEDLAGLYRAAIRQHASAPVGYRQPVAATHRHEEFNPQCGDRIEIQLQVGSERIEAAAFDGEACAICIASASLLCSLAPGQTVAGLQQLGNDLRQALDPAAPPELLLHEDLHALLGVRPYPSRIRCATLPWTAARRALSG
jgi:nitrogen fixation NifU-like protein